MSDTLSCVSNSRAHRINVGAYDRPFSGVGVEFDPLGIQPGRSGLTLHETGFNPAHVDWNFPAVFSPFWRFYYNADRGHCVLFADGAVELEPGQMMLIPPHCLIHCLGRNPVAHFWMAFSFVRRLRPGTVVPILLPPRDTDLCLIRDLGALVLSEPEGRPNEAIYRNSLALLHVVLARPELHWQASPPENLLRARAHIEARIGDKLASPALARIAGLSVAGFNRAFRRYFNSTAGRYVSEMRVREAARRLLQTDQTIDSIADETGFPNRAYFSRVFKKVTGESPALFRHKHRRMETAPFP
jgi:AraC family transcriptional regulator, arabinose operon regulatory protein